MVTATDEKGYTGLQFCDGPTALDVCLAPLRKRVAAAPPSQKKQKAKPFCGKPAAFYLAPSFRELMQSIPDDIRWPCAYFVHQLHWQFAMRRITGRTETRLVYDLLRKIIPHRLLDRVRMTLIDLGVITTDMQYITGRAIEYKLRPAYWHTKRYECGDDRLNWKIRAAGNARRRLDATTLQRNYWAEQLTIDPAEAEPRIANLVPKKMPEDRTSAEAALLIDDYQQWTRHTLRAWTHGDGWFVRDRLGRVHFPFVSLPRALRDLVRFQGQPLVGVDISATQPTCLFLLARWWCRGSKAKKTMTRMEFKDDADPYRCAFWELMQDHDDVPNDVREFGQLCLSGRLYDPSEWASRGLGGMTRDEIKERMLISLMAMNAQTLPIREPFADRFPTIADMLSKLKRVTPKYAKYLPEEAYEHQTHSRVAWLLQNVESVIMHRACKWFFAKYPELPLLTIHDSLYTVGSEQRQLLREALLTTFDELSVVPKLKDC